LFHVRGQTVNRLYTFQGAAQTSVAASSVLSVTNKSPVIPLAGHTVIRIMQAFSGVSAGDASGQISLLGLQIGYQLQTSQGVALFTQPMPVMPFNAFTLPKSTNSIVFAVSDTPEAVEVAGTDILSGVTAGTIGQLVLIAIALFSNADSVSAHTAACSIGGVVGYV
jgi:hypothetical protein